MSVNRATRNLVRSRANFMGITSTGRGTCDRLDLNDRYHNEGAIIRARRLWIRAGWHPPSSDPRQNL